MKAYQVQVRLSYYACVDVEADDEHQAHDRAIRRAHYAMEQGHGSWGEEPEVVSIDEIKGESK